MVNRRRMPFKFLFLLIAGTALYAQIGTTPVDRPRWVLNQTLGPASLVGGLFSSGLSTWRDRPEEYNTHWSGFGQRYGLRLTGIAAQNVMEAGLGALINEDPRYVKQGGAFKQRLASTFRQTVLAKRTDGVYAPAYARYAAITGANFLSNSWRPDTDATVSSAFIRTGYGFLGRLAGNAFTEFAGDAWHRLFGR